MLSKNAQKVLIECRKSCSTFNSEKFCLYFDRAINEKGDKNVK